ncbi:MAG: MFS transporter [Nitrososphaerota archaeon]|jgi:MFS family permease|nr:MFS transporter [Nitrososphaerota archaeon]
MAAIDSTVVYLAIPAMERYFGSGIAYLSLVIVAYLIASTAMMIPVGSIATRFGRRKIYLLGFLIYTVASGLIAASPSIILVVILRAAQGTGAGIMGTQGIPILLSAFPPNERGRAVGINSTSWAIGTLVGPILGGLLVIFDWRYVFLINIPIGVVALVLGFFRVPKDEGLPTAKVSYSNVLGFILFLVPLTAGISFYSLPLIFAGVALIPLFLALERRNNLVPHELLKNSRYYPILGASTLQALAFFGLIYALSLYLQYDLGFSPVSAALVLVAYPLTSIVSTPLGGYLLDRTHRGGLLMATGLALQGVSTLFLSTQLGTPSGFVTSLLLAISGVGGSIYWATSTTLAVDSAGSAFRSIASSALFTIRNMMLIIGIASFPLFVAGTSSGTVSSILFLPNTSLDILHATVYYVTMIGTLSLAAIPFIVLYIFRRRGDERNVRDESNMGSNGSGLL